MQTVFLHSNLQPGVSVAIVEIAFSGQPNISEQRSKTARMAAEIAARQKLVISKNELGKPIVQNLPLHVSLSHSKLWAAAAVSRERIVGIDVETIENRIERIAHKFLLPHELVNISQNRVETLTLYWSAKESLYKLYSFKQLNFAEHLKIEPFEMQQQGIITASVVLPGFEMHQIAVYYRFFVNHVLTVASAPPALFNRLEKSGSIHF
jgi:phosphopantetheinyl transferase